MDQLTQKLAVGDNDLYLTGSYRYFKFVLHESSAYIFEHTSSIGTYLDILSSSGTTLKSNSG